MTSKTLYIHYGSSPFNSEYFRKTCRLYYTFDKPCGLWSSPVDSNLSWKRFCKENSYIDHDFDYAFQFYISDDAKVLHVYSEEDIARYLIGGSASYIPHIDFGTLIKDYDAIEVHLSANNGELRKSRIFLTWEVDSLVVWNPDVVIPV